MQELFGPLTCGGVLLLATPGGEKDTQYLARLCVTERVSCMVLVPSALEVLLQVRRRARSPLARFRQSFAAATHIFW